MHLQTADPVGPGLTPPSTANKPTTALPFGAAPPLNSLSGPTYLTPQTLTQQVAYALSSSLFAYSPTTFDLDAAVRAWHKASAPNAAGQVPALHALDVRLGAGGVVLGYVFSPDFDPRMRGVPQSLLVSSGGLELMRAALDQLALLYGVAVPTVLQVSAVGYAAESRTGLVADYVTPMGVADELGLGLVASKSVFEAQHMALLGTVLAGVLPTAHVYDGISVGRETGRVIDVLDVGGLKRVYEAVVGEVREDLGSRRLTNEGKLGRVLGAFNAELGTEYKAFEYHGHATPAAVLVVFGTVEASLAAQVADALAEQGAPVGVINVRVYRPFAEEEFLAALPPSARQVTVLGQVVDQAAVSDPAVSSLLYADVLAAVNFQSLAAGAADQKVFDVKYARETVWTVAKMEALLRSFGAKPGQERAASTPLQLGGGEKTQYSFWDVDVSDTAAAPQMVARLLADDDALNVAVRSGHDNLVQGGTLRTDLRCSSKSIEAAYAVKEADVAVVGAERLLGEFDVLGSVKEGGTLIVKAPGWKDEEVEKKLSAFVRKTLAVKKVELLVLDPTASAKVGEEPELASFLLQLAFLKVARPDVFEKGLKKLQAGGDVLETLAQDLDVALKKVDIDESWLTLELEENEAIPPPEDLTINSFVPFDNIEEEPPTFLQTWATAAKGLAFKEAYGTKSALRPDLGVKTSIVHVKEHKRLTPESYDRNIFHIEFDLGTSGVKYEIGEALGIHPENDSGEVAEFMKWYGLQPDEIVEVPSREDPHVLENRTVHQALLQNVDLFGRPPKRFYEALSAFATSDAEKTQLLMLGTGGNQEATLEFKRRAEVDTVTYADLLTEFPSAHPPFHDLIKLISPIKRREYSVASSQKATPTSIALLIVTVNWVDPTGRDRFGSATRYLNSLPIGAPVTVSVKPSVMKLPPKTTSPIIMAGLGTGLAPFRAFIQERAYQRMHGHEIGDCFLYMGSRHQREEYLYGEEWEAYRDAGVITLLGRAFSRDQPQKVYIQDVMRDSLSELRRAYLREEGAFYLCGPTWPVPDVTEVLEEAVRVEGESKAVAGGKRRKVDGRKEIERLKEEGRYVLEVY